MKLRITLLLIIYTILSYGCANMVDFNDDISSSTSSGDFELVLNRSTGVAPLTVFFDAEDYGANYFESVDEPFHDLEYRWTFGDDEDATWDYGTRPGEISKNEATGPVAAHVFEEAGEYTVEVEIFDGTDSYTEEVQITVYDPDCDDENDPLYDPDQSFENTVLVANNESDFDWNDYKEFHEEWDEEDWDKFDKYVYTEFDTALSEALADGGRRILFKSGQTFDFSSQTTVDVDSPVLIGSFGSGDNPIISLNESFTGYFAVFATSDDIRFMDFEIDGNELTDPTPIRGMYLGGDNCLALRLYGHDLGYLAVLAGNNQATVDCECYNIVGGDGNMPIYAKDAFGLFIAGCSLDSNYGGEYNLRYQGGTEGVISNNTLARCGENKALLTIRGDAEEEEVSGRHVVNDNFFDGESCSSMAFHVTITPQNYERNEPIEDVIFERNYLDTASGGNLLSINAKYISVRNNLFDATDGSQKPILSVGYSSNIGGLPYPGYIYIYHNTFFKNTSDGVTAVTLYEQDGAAHDCIIKNNFLYAPNVTKSGEGNTGPNLYTDYGEDNVISNNTFNYTSSETEAVDEFDHFYDSVETEDEEPMDDDPDDWVMVTTSYGAKRGEQVPVWSDFFRESINSTTTRNLGAVLAED